MPIAQTFPLTTVLQCWSAFPQASNHSQSSLLAFNLPSRLFLLLLFPLRFRPFILLINAYEGSCAASGNAVCHLCQHSAPYVATS